jgi:hypothetical protein
MGGLEISKQMFAEVTDASGLGAAYKLGKFDGILGMVSAQYTYIKTIPRRHVTLILASR